MLLRLSVKFLVSAEYWDRFYISYENAPKLCIQSYRILGECLLISSLPGKALRMLVDIASLAE